MKFSIIVANYNYDRYLPLAVKSLLAQSYSDIEIIIVDDGSTDRSHAIIKDLHHQYPDQVKYLFQENNGHGGAIYSGFQIATGTIIGFLDSDDMWNPRKVEKVIQLFKENPDLVGVIHPLNTIDADGVVLSDAILPPEVPNGDLSQVLLETGATWVYPPTSGITIHRSALERILPMDPPEWRFWPDGCLLYCSAFLGKVMVIPETLGSYRNHGKNTYWSEGSPDRAQQAKSLNGIQITNVWLNQFLAKINSHERVNLLDNLHYRRAQYYYQEQFNWLEFQEISSQIMGWRFYSSKDKIQFLFRFWMKNLKFVLNFKTSVENIV